MPTTVGWNVPSWPDSGDETDDALYLAVGRFLTGWEQVESSFAELCAAFVTKGSVETTIAARAFGSIAMSRGRAEMLQAGAEAYHIVEPLDDPDLQAFASEALSDPLGPMHRRCSGYRSDAHGDGIMRWPMESRLSLAGRFSRSS